MNKINTIHFSIVISLLLLVGILLRSKAISTPFWVDEFSTASQAKQLVKFGLSAFSRSDIGMEPNNILPHIVVAVSFTLFGFSVAAARTPFIIAGLFLPVLVFLVARKNFSFRVAIGAGLMLATSYWQLAWSSQARGYVFQEVIALLLLLVYSWQTKKTLFKYVLLAILGILGIATHISLILFIAAFVLTELYRNKSIFIAVIQKYKRQLILCAIIFAISLLTIFFVTSFKLQNNVWYYHAFLWKEQTIISMFAFIGLFSTFFEKREKTLTFFFTISSILYFSFFFFVFPPYSTRYILPIYPLLIIFAAKGIEFITISLSKRHRTLLFSFFIFFIFLNGNEFTFKPKPFYSPNHFMREIPLVDYDEVYKIIKSELLNDPSAAVIDTWPDRALWYLPEYAQNLYIFRWSEFSGTSNGISMETEFAYDIEGKKILPRSGTPQLGFVSDLKDLTDVMNNHKTGVIWIDDTSLPAEVLTFVYENFSTLLHTEHLAADDNPYSIWPGTLYKWDEKTLRPSSKQVYTDLHKSGTML